MDPELANDLSEGGILWFTNLTDPDPWYTLPILSGLLLYCNVEMAMGKQSLSGESASQSKTAILLKDGFQSLALFIPSFMANSPSGVQIYLATTFVFTLVQSAALRNDWFRKLVDLPPTDAPKPEAKLAKEFLNLTKMEREAYNARGGVINDNARDKDIVMRQVVGKGVLAPGFEASFEGVERKSSIKSDGSNDSLLPKPSMMFSKPKQSSNHLEMPNIPMEVMKAANEGRPMPRPIQMVPLSDEQVMMKDGKTLADSLKKKSAKSGKGQRKRPSKKGR